MNVYKVYIDDSGSKDYEDPYTRDFIENPPDTDRYLNYWRKNYFVLTAVRIPQTSLKTINQEINDLRRRRLKHIK